MQAGQLSLMRARRSPPGPLPSTTSPRPGLANVTAPSARSGRSSPSSPKLAAMKDSRVGETAWLIGNGPSVRIEDLDRLQDRLCFAFNRFHLSYGDTRLRPEFTISGDRQMIEDFGDDIVTHAGGTVLLSNEEPPALTGDYCWLRQVIGFPSLFSRDASRRVTPGGSSVFVAMQVAYWLGIRDFMIYGADFKFSYAANLGSDDRMRAATGEGNHFIKNYRSGRPWCPPAVLNILSSFLAARLLIESEGGTVRNVTRGGALEVFERADFDEALRT